VNTQGRLRTPEEFGNIIVRTGADAVPGAEATPSGEAGEAHAEEEHIDHVPVKKKGARKR